ncbi:EAL domain-containing protein [Qipengyuania citrea]|uniref:EAL domain-containing protein n=1 Tax=Qipengyuania citrea TaxID=225971 RepID=UPI003298D7FB
MLRFFKRRHSHTSKSVAQRRRKIVLVALTIGIVTALIEFPMPAEDAFRAARSELRSHEADRDIVVVAVDDRTLNTIHASEPSREQDALVVDRLFAEGATRVVFDRAYADPDKNGHDEAFARTLARHRGRVWLGSSPVAANGLQQHAGLLPVPELRDSAEIASMMGQGAPFGLSVRFPTSTVVDGRPVPSISAVLADYAGRQGWYRPDFAIDPATIPTISYTDVLANAVPDRFAGRTIVIAPTHLESTDFHNLPLGGKIPGVYFHVMGAQTLKSGLPVDLGWIPALLLATALLAYQARRRRPAPAATWTALAFLPASALALDTLQINIDIMPAAIAIGIGIVRLNLLAARYYSRTTNLLLREALEPAAENAQMDVYALKIANVDDLTRVATPHEQAELVERIIKILQSTPIGGAPEVAVAFERDTLIWQAPRLTAEELEENSQGLIALLRSGHPLMGGKRVDVTLAVDTNRTLPFQTRVHNAMQAAEIGSRKRLRTVVADTQWLDVRERRLSLLDDLDAAIADKTIAVGYQPKVDLLSGRVVGAETLLRWRHPVLGLMDAAEIVAIAEEHDRIDELTVQIIDRALRECKSLVMGDPAFRLAINLSPQTLSNVMILYHLARLRSHHGFPGKNLIIEVTESAPLDNRDIKEIVRGIRKEGITLSIDDFGTGHSTLTNLDQIPSSEIKIDRRFVINMATSEESAAVVQGTIAMAHTLGKTVVAEGVEDDLTAERLRRMGCDLAQGFLYSPAVPVVELLDMITEDRVAA